MRAALQEVQAIPTAQEMLALFQSHQVVTVAQVAIPTALDLQALATRTAPQVQVLATRMDLEVLVSAIPTVREVRAFLWVPSLSLSPATQAASPEAKVAQVVRQTLSRSQFPTALVVPLVVPALFRLLLVATVVVLLEVPLEGPLEVRPVAVLPVAVLLAAAPQAVVHLAVVLLAVVLQAMALLIAALLAVVLQAVGLLVMVLLAAALPAAQGARGFPHRPTLSLRCRLFPLPSKPSPSPTRSLLFSSQQYQVLAPRTPQAVAQVCLAADLENPAMVLAIPTMAQATRAVVQEPDSPHLAPRSLLWSRFSPVRAATHSNPAAATHNSPVAVTHSSPVVTHNNPAVFPLR